MISKKIIASVLALAMTASTFTFTINLGNANSFGVSSVMVNAAETDASEFTYTILDDNTVELTKFVGTSTNIVIPSKIEGKPVTSIGSTCFSSKKTIESIVIPNSVKKIGWKGFAECTSLKSIEIPDSVTTMDTHTFYKCSNLQSVKLSKNLTEIPERAFEKCYALETIDMPESLTKVGDYAFFMADKIDNIIVPESVTYIGAGAFQYCDELSNIQTPTELDYLGGWAFNGTKFLKNATEDFVYVGKWVTTCTNTALTTATLKEGTKGIASWGMDYTRKLTTLYVPNSLEYINVSAFNYNDSISDIYFDGTRAEWNNVIIESKGNTKLLNATVHCIDDEESSSEDESSSDVDSSSESSSEEESSSNIDSSSESSSEDESSQDPVNDDDVIWTGSKSEAFTISGLDLTQWETVSLRITLSNGLTWSGLRAESHSLGGGDYCELMTYKQIGNVKTYDIPISAANKDTIENITLQPGNVTITKVQLIGTKKSGGDDSSEEEHTHSYTSKVTTAATCTENGVKTFTCSCGDSYTEVIKATGHKYVDKVVPPTTTSQGYTEHTCSVCGDSYKDNIVDPIVEEKAPEVKLMLQKSGDGKYSRFILQVKISDMIKADKASYAITANGKTSTTNITSFYSAYKIGDQMHKAPSGYGYVISDAIYGIKSGDSITVKLNMSNFNAPYNKTITVK